MNNMRDKLYSMGLIETFCFIHTVGKDWWFIKGDALIYSDGSYVGTRHITTAQHT